MEPCLKSTNYIDQEAHNVLFSSDWEKHNGVSENSCQKEDLSYHKYIYQIDQWCINHSYDPSSKLAHRVKIVQSSDHALQDRIMSVIMKAGITEFFVSVEEVGDYGRIQWVNLYLNEDDYSNSISNKIDGQSVHVLPSVLD